MKTNTEKRIHYQRKQSFSLIEIVLSLVVVIVGIVGMFALLPTVADQNRSTIAKSYAGDAAEQFLHFNASKIVTDWGWLGAFPEIRPGSVENTFVWSDESLIENDNLDIRFATFDAEQSFDPTLHQKGVFVLEQRTGSQIDFVAVLRVWKNVVEYDNGGMSANINVEVSWPMNKPYDVRDKDVFSLEVFKKLEGDVAILEPDPEEEENMVCEYVRENGGGFSTAITSVVENVDGTHTIILTVSHNGCSGPECQELSHYSIEAIPGTYSDVSFDGVDGELSLGPNLGSDPFDGFKVDETEEIGDGVAGSFTVTYTLTGGLQAQQVSAKAGTNGNITYFDIINFEEVKTCTP